ncbi:A/G-specific adenine glycosylase [uncultured Dokdonia sp.]|uniref:A/G-specific adenine glycosylase n=1 Tax=uncultured Dokdonia sp. TaxID=575653 RepID=UPI002620E335|nr:A/G-specific adenine glycosylase [uncultured Dokdonia sp.]
MSFSNKLIAWYLEHKRDMPWRNTTHPYHIWLSEIILQQTRVAQGLPYYIAFTEAFPTVQDLAQATEEEVLKLWQGLGYYSRGRNLHASAKMIVEEMDGVFPSTYEEIKKLKGVGDYTASAIASICFNEPTAVVDGNVYRVLSRVYGIDTPINSTAGVKEFKALAQELINEDRPADFNQAIMEFGAIQCKPQNPYCLHCIYNDSCVALQQNKVSELPVKLKKTKVKHKYFHYLYIKDKQEQTIIKQRTGKGIWQGLYEFPVIEELAALQEGEEDRFRESVKNHSLLQGLVINDIDRYNDTPIVHKLSHQHLHTTFWIVTVDEITDNATPINRITELPVPVLIGNFIEKLL